MDNKKEKLFTVKEAAKLIDGLTEYRIRQMCKNGQLDCFKAIPHKPLKTRKKNGII